LGCSPGNRDELKNKVYANKSFCIGRYKESIGLAYDYFVQQTNIDSLLYVKTDDDVLLGCACFSIGSSYITLMAICVPDNSDKGLKGIGSLLITILKKVADEFKFTIHLSANENLQPFYSKRMKLTV